MIKSRFVSAFAVAALVGIAACQAEEEPLVEETVIEEPALEQPAPAPVEPAPAEGELLAPDTAVEATEGEHSM